MDAPSDVIAQTTNRMRAGTYVAIVVLCLLATFAYKLRFDGAFACPAPPSPDTFLADCHATGYADYDHGAFWFGLEPSAVSAAHAASVLFLGSSRMQFGFTAPSTDEWFSKASTSYYLLGFSYTENLAFAVPLLRKIDPQAKVYIINVDRFFADAETVPAAELLHDRDARTRYSEKRFWQGIQHRLCTAVPGICGHLVAFIRSRSNGTWQRIGTAPFKASGVADGPATDVDQWTKFADLAERFVSQLPVPRQCVLLTIVPYDGTRHEEAQTIARSLGTELLAPEVDDLRTFDGSHLDPPSAEWWSAAFFRLAGPRIQHCLSDSKFEDSTQP